MGFCQEISMGLIYPEVTHILRFSGQSSRAVKCSQWLPGLQGSSPTRNARWWPVSHALLHARDVHWCSGGARISAKQNLIFGGRNQ